MFTAALFTIAKPWKLPKMSINRGMDKEDVVCVYIYIYIYICNGISLIKKNKEARILVIFFI